ncbi:MAG: hypothetical protein E6X49_22895 [Leclercia adecarboxylata]|nr:hypothetical protein [Leclercia adecarboxylata]
MSDSEIIELLSNTDMFELNSPMSHVLRWVGWGLIKMLAFLANGVESVVNNIYSLNGFFSSKHINKLVNDFLPLIWVILAISIAFLGLKIIFDRDFKMNKLVKNIAISVSVVMLLPMGMTHLEKITSKSIEGVKSEYKLSANKIIKDNLYDLYYLDSKDFESKEKNNISVKNITNATINICEEVDTSDLKNKDVFKYKLVTDAKGKNVKRELDSSFFGLFSENYYRFKFNFWGIFISLGCTAITLLATSFRISRIIFELGFVKFFGIMYSFADISNGQRIKEIIRCIVSNFVVLFLTSVLLKMYLLFSTWSIEQSKGITQSVLLIGASVAVIDGPNIIERVLGIDAGVKSGWSVVTAGYVAGQGLLKTANGVAKGVGKALQGAGAIGSSGSEHLKDLMEQKNGNGSKNGKDNMNKPKSGLHDEMKNKSKDADNKNNQKDQANPNKNDNNNDSVLDDLNSGMGVGDSSLENDMSNIDSMDSENSSLENDMPSTDSMDSENSSLENDMPSTDSMDSENSSLENDMPSTDSMDSENSSLENDMSNINSMDSENSSLENDMPNIDSMDSENSSLENDMPNIDSMDSENSSLENDMSNINSMDLGNSSLENDMSSKDSVSNGNSSLESGMSNIPGSATNNIPGTIESEMSNTPGSATNNIPGTIETGMSNTPGSAINNIPSNIETGMSNTPGSLLIIFLAILKLA